MNPEFEQTQKFPSRLRSFSSLRKNNKSSPKNTNKPKLRSSKINKGLCYMWMRYYVIFLGLLQCYFPLCYLDVCYFVILLFLFSYFLVCCLNVIPSRQFVISSYKEQQLGKGTFILFLKRNVNFCSLTYISYSVQVSILIPTIIANNFTIDSRKFGCVNVVLNRFVQK